MQTKDVLQAWGRILQGRKPSLSIEITRECPLRCPGCYAYEEGHLEGDATLRTLADFRGQELINNVLEVVDRHRPLHLSIVGGDPLVRYREVEALLPQLFERGIHVQVVTSAFRRLNPEWASFPKLTVVVSIDGLQPEHDVRRKPATYERILKNIEGQRIVIHSTITSQMVQRPGYLREFLEFWTPRDEIRKVWFSTFTPQIGDDLPEMLSREQRLQVMEELVELRREFPKLDMREGVIKQLAEPPKSPAECTFALTTETISADLKTKVTPCQFGGNPDCSSCGCIASLGLSAVSKHKLAGFIPIGAIFKASIWAGNLRSKPVQAQPQPAELKVLT